MCRSIKIFPLVSNNKFDIALSKNAVKIYQK